MVSSLPRGFTEIRQKMAAFLEARMPVIVAAARTEWGLEEWELPNFRKYDAVDPDHVEEYPAICIDGAQDSDHRIIGYEPDASIVTLPAYNVNMAIVVETPFNPEEQEWADPAYDETVRLRDDLTALVQNVMVNDQDFDGMGVRFEPATLNTQYLGVIPQNSSETQLSSAVLMTFQVRKTNNTYQPEIGTANTITIVEEPLIP